MSDDLILIPGEQKFDPIPQIKPSGAVIVNGQHLADTLKCEHCRYTWIPIKGSGKKRGFCMKCMGVLCGKKECLIECLPYIKRLEIKEMR